MMVIPVKEPRIYANAGHLLTRKEVHMGKLLITADCTLKAVAQMHIVVHVSLFVVVLIIMLIRGDR